MVSNMNDKVYSKLKLTVPRSPHRTIHSVVQLLGSVFLLEGTR